VSGLQALVLTMYFAGLVILAFFALHRGWLVLRERMLPALPQFQPDPSFRPTVTVQLPIYNERFVVARLLDAVAQLDWPRDRLEVQILDDSSDDTVQEAVGGARRLRALGIDTTHIRRTHRVGFKAGALADGLLRAKGEFLLVLDADFVPPPDLLHTLLAPMQDPGVGMVQARWGHLNRATSALTQTEALFLDAHFLIETAVRARSGAFFNFHGTAGIWRRRAIVEAGGWSADTLTEDLDLSYRAQMVGWRFVYLPHAVVPAELPETLAAFRRQQARWTQGAAATARKLLWRLCRGPWPAVVKREALLHLGAHIVYPVTLAVTLLAVPAVLVRHAIDVGPWLWLDVALAIAIIGPTRLFYGAAARRAGIRAPGVLWTARLLLAATALAISNTRAAWAGWLGRTGHFERTPKTRGQRGLTKSYRPSSALAVRWLDGGVAVYLTIGLVFAALQGGLGAVPFLALMAAGFLRAAARG
jgi:cellulose synthase/poly-beta-1,6-N-acetylglucosamine synthase-like glycosyltransferase